MIRGKLRGTDDIQEHDNRIGDVITDFSRKEEKIVIIDADSLIYIASWPGKDPETLENRPPYTEEEYHIAEGFLTEHILRILSNIEEYYDIIQCYICVKGKKNFRYELYSDYKSKRPPALPIINHLVEYLVKEHNAIRAEGFEADDLAFSISETLDHTGIICSPDKDLRNIPSILYNYQKDMWEKISEEQARHNLATQILTGDGGDGVNFTKGIGPKTAQKLITPGMTSYQYIKAILPVYQKLHGEKAKEIMRLCYNLLKFHRVDIREESIKNQAA